MFIFKKHVDRRTVLKGAGVQVLRPVSSHGQALFVTARHHPSGTQSRSLGSSMSSAGNE